MRISDLQTIIKKLKDEMPIDMWHYHALVADMQKAVPTIWMKRRKGYTRKACRLYFASWLTGCEISSFKNLTEKEAYFINQWFYGMLGETNDPELNQIFNLSAYADFCIEHKTEIQVLAEQIRKEKLKK